MPHASMLLVGRHRLALGRDLRLVERDATRLWLEGAMRLRPGQVVELTGAWPDDMAGLRGRITHWRVIRLTTEGPYYRGCCQMET